MLYATATGDEQLDSEAQKQTLLFSYAVYYTTKSGSNFSGEMKWGHAPSCKLHETHVVGTERKLVHTKRIESQKSQKSLRAPRS